MIIQERVRLLVGSYYDSKTMQTLMDEAVRLVIGELPEEVLEALQVEETDTGTGVTVSNKRVIRAHKDGYPARHLDSYLRSRIESESSYYEAQSWAPAYYIYGGKCYVKPDGGTVVTVSYPSVSISSSSVTGVPDQLLDLFVIRCADLVITDHMRRERDKISTVVNLPTIPASVIAPTFSYQSASATSPQTTTIAALPSVETYLAPPDPSLPAQPTIGTLDLSGISVPTMPTLGDITYVPSEIAQVASVQVGTLPDLPAYSVVPFTGNTTIPTLPTLDFTTDVDGADIAAPVAPLAPSIVYNDAVASIIGSTAVGSLPTPPSLPSAVFEGDLSSITANLPSSFVSSATPPTPPTLGDVTYVPPEVRTLQDTTISALPAPPVLGSVPFEGDLSAITANLPSSFTSSAVAPVAPTLGEITYVSPSITDLQSTIISALPAPPVIGAVTFGGDIASITAALPSSFSTAAQPPVPPNLPTISYSPVTPDAVNAISIGALPSVPTYSAPTYSGNPDSILSEIPVPIGDSDLTAPVAPSAPTLTYPGVVLGSIASTSIGAFPTPPTIEVSPFEGDISSVGAGLPSTLDLSTDVNDAAITAPSAPVAPDVSYIDPVVESAVAAAITLPTTLPVFIAPTSVTLDWTDFDTYAGDTHEDAEMMAGLLGKQRAIIENNQQEILSARADFERTLETYRAEVQEAIEEARMAQQVALQNAQSATEANVRVAFERIQGALKAYELQLQGYQGELSVYNTKVDTKFKEFQGNLDLATRAVSQREGLYIQKYAQDLEQKRTQFQGDVQDHLREVDRVIEQARLDQQRLIAEYQTQADARLRDAVQQVQLDLQIYQGKLEGYRADAEVYATTMNGRFQQMQGNIARVAQGFAEVERVKIQKYSADSQEALGKFQGEISLWREQVAELIAQAELDHRALELQIRDSQQIELQNALQEVQAEIEAFRGQLQKYQTEGQVYATQIEGEVSAFRANLELATGPIQTEQRLYVEKYIADSQRTVQEHSAYMQHHMAEVQRVIQQAEITARELQAEYQISTDARLRAAIQQTEAAVQQYTGYLRKYEAEANVYRTQIEGEVAAFRANLDLATQAVQAEQRLYLEKYISDTNRAIQQFQGDMQDHMAEVQRVIRQAEITSETLRTEFQVGSDIDLRSAIQQTQGQVEVLRSQLQRYQIEAEVYRAVVEGEVAEFRANLELATGPVQAQQGLYIQKYGGELATEVQRFQTENEQYIKQIDVAIEDARLAQTRLLEQAGMETNVEVQNRIQEAQTALAEYERELARYQAQLAQYQAQVTGVFEEFRLEYQKAFEPWATEQRLHLELYGQKVQESMQEYRAVVEDHMREIDREMRNADLTLARLTTNAQLLTQAGLQNEAQRLQAQVEKYRQSLELVRTEVELYLARVNAAIQEFATGITLEVRLYEAATAAETRVFEVKVQSARADWEARYAAYQAAVQRNFQQAEIAAREAAQIASQATEVDVANKARGLEAAISLYQAQLQKHREDVETYNAEVQSSLAKFQAEHAARQDLIRSMNYDMSRIRTRYKEARSAFMRFFWPHRSYTIRQPVI